jgi:hypothetical protein
LLQRRLRPLLGRTGRLFHVTPRPSSGGINSHKVIERCAGIERSLFGLRRQRGGTQYRGAFEGVRLVAKTTAKSLPKTGYPG